MIDEAQHQEQRDEKNEEPHDLSNEFWYRDLSPFLEVGVPQVMIDQRDDDTASQQDEGGDQVISELRSHAVNPDRGVEGQREAEKLKWHTQANAGAALQQAASRQYDKKGRDENSNGECCFLRLREKVEHRVCGEE